MSSIVRMLRIGRFSNPVLVALAIVLTVGLPEELHAQAGQPIGAQNLQAYWHVFIAYAAAWLLVGGWAFSIFWRLGAIERDRSHDR